MLNWANRFNIFCFLDHNGYQPNNSLPASFDCLLAAGANKHISVKHPDELSVLRSFHEKNKGWLFGHLNYPSSQEDFIGFPGGFFFIPEYLIRLKGNEVIVHLTSANAVQTFNEINTMPDFINEPENKAIHIQQRTTEQEYLLMLDKIKKHIQRGDCYEINFCQSFYAENVHSDPLFLFHRLNSLSPNPFAAFYKLEHSYCLCASPERFITKKGAVLTSQPIKGTAKRNLIDCNEDAIIKESLSHSEKDRTENVMIVDLVRNDLSKICERGSVHVDELFGVYTFPNLHHMISTISGNVNEKTHWTEILNACFPMGSMTGAPKKRVMELIEQYEAVPRGLFSGTIGYIDPEGDFDFNVVIRSIFLNTDTRILSYMAGGGITINSNPQMEYLESMAKAEVIRKLLSPSVDTSQ
jgi:para-aminobenzoate synthetase component 1